MRNIIGKTVVSAETGDRQGRNVVAASGEYLGIVSDLLVDEKTGAFGALEVAWGHRLVGLRRRYSLVPASRDLRIGPHAVVVPDGALDGDGDGSHAA